MRDAIPENVLRAVTNGQLIRAIKLLRNVENISLKDAKQKIEAVRDSLTSDSYSDKDRQIATVVHTHTPARRGSYNIEKDMPTEAFLFFQKGEVKEAIRVLKAVKGISEAAAKNTAKTFYSQHPEYQSDEIENLMRSRPTSTSTSSAVGGNKKKKMGFIEMIIIGVILFSFLKKVFS